MKFGSKWNYARLVFLHGTSEVNHKSDQGSVKFSLALILFKEDRVIVANVETYE